MAWAEARNYQYRYEIPKAVVDEFAIKDYVHNILGKNDFAKVTYPGYCKVSDPILTGRLKDVVTTGMIHGREALVAATNLGYHKVAAGENVTFPDIKELPTKDKVLNGEILNPAGISRILVKKGNFVHWGARIPALDTAFIFVQHRELLSYYEHVFADNFGYIIFAINDPSEQPGLIANFQSFLIPEWDKKALRGTSPEDAFQIKLDEENNTNITRAAGDLNAEIKLRLADVVERFNIIVSKAGVFEELG